jgi:predicted RNase H-like HicB family nuclease
MARDAMEGLIEVMVEHGEAIPESDGGVPHP